MDVLLGILMFLQILVSLLMVGIIMMQRPRQEGLGAAFGDAAANQMFGAQTTNVLQKGTVYFAVFFFLNSAVMATILTHREDTSEIDDVLRNAPAPVVEESSEEDFPGLEDRGGLLDLPSPPEPVPPTPESAPVETETPPTTE
ncbi:MAG: preprotein translocase subunit SecG [Verrucomicrobiota bacterium]